MHPPLEGRYGPGTGNVLVLRRASEGVDSNYTGWVPVPWSAAYARHVLP